MKFILSICAVFAATAMAQLPVPGAQPAAPRPVSSATIQQQLLAQVNIVRATNGKQPLCLNTKLSAASQAHSADMAAGGWIGSTGTGGTTPAGRAAAQTFNSTMVAEIVGAGYTDASVAVKEWMASPAYSIYVLGDYKYMGAGMSANEAQTYKSFWVLDFDKEAVGEVCA